MTKKVVTIESHRTILEAARIMNEKTIEGLPVIEGGKVVGIVTERDILRRVVAKNLDPSQVLIKEVMSQEEMNLKWLEAIIEIYKERKIHVDFVNFQKELKTLKVEVEELRVKNPRFKAEVNGIIREIEKYQTTVYSNYIKRFFVKKVSEISSKISRLKALGS